uniref:(northern house mosquito) hypothetical protein n=1 Tax=Culex pipiens TaxID=7175 RepID=A0A8D8FF99_CULPI
MASVGSATFAVNAPATTRHVFPPRKHSSTSEFRECHALAVTAVLDALNVEVAARALLRRRMALFRLKTTLKLKQSLKRPKMRFTKSTTTCGTRMRRTSFPIRTRPVWCRFLRSG